MPVMARTGRASGARVGGASRRGAADSPLARFCRSLPGTTQDVKWVDDLVFSVGGKMYASFHVDDRHRLGFKCTEQDMLRLVQIDGIIPAPYAARFGWVSVLRRGVLGAAELRRLIRKSYGLVVEGLPGRVRRELEEKAGGTRRRRPTRSAAGPAGRGGT